jgi:hypothetical protein
MVCIISITPSPTFQDTTHGSSHFLCLVFSGTGAIKTHLRVGNRKRSVAHGGRWYGTADVPMLNSGVHLRR